MMNTIPPHFIETSDGGFTHPSKVIHKSGAADAIQDAVGTAEIAKAATEQRVAKVVKRVRQSSNPTMNKLESEWFFIVSQEFPSYPKPRAQSVTFKLCNGVKYTPDVFVAYWPGRYPHCPVAWEVKGPFAREDSMLKLKMFAHEYPEIRVLLVWKEDGKWQTQEILP